MSTKLFEIGRVLGDVTAALKILDMSQVPESHKQLFLRHVQSFQEVLKKVGLNHSSPELAICEWCGNVYKRKALHQKYCSYHCRRKDWDKRHSKMNAKGTGER